MSTIRKKLYLHSNKAGNYETGIELGLTGEALRNFGYALYEVGLDCDIDTETGDVVIVSCNSRALEAEVKS